MKSQAVIKNNLISYQSYGENKNISIVFLHGWRSEGAVWTDVVKLMQSKGFEGSIYCLDLPGFGESSTPNKDFNLDDYCVIVDEFMRKMDLKKVVLVGHSFGGRIAIKLAAKHFGWIEKLVLVDSAGLNLDTDRKKIIQIAAKVARPIFYPNFMKNMRKWIYLKMGSGDYLATPELQQIFLNTINEDLTECLKKIETPTLILWGGRDKDTPLEYAKIMKREIVGAKLRVFEEAGHFCFLDSSEKFASEMINFLGDK